MSQSEQPTDNQDRDEPGGQPRPERRPEPKPPTQRAFVLIPAAVFFLFDTVLLIAAGRSIGSAIMLAAASAVLVGWILNRRFEGVRQRYERRARETAQETAAQAADQDVASATDRPAVPTANDAPGPIAPGTAPGSVRPPVGSWSNPSGGQRLRDRWDRAMPFARRHRRPGERHRN